MKKDTHRLAPVVDIAKQREQKAATELARARQFCDKVQLQVQQMHHYRDEYRQQSLIGQTHSMATMRDTQVFLSRLNDTISALEGQHSQAVRRAEALLQEWHKSRAWMQSLEHVVDRQIADFEKKRAIREQKQSDELAGLYAARSGELR